MMTCSRESILESILNGEQEVMFQKNQNAGNRQCYIYGNFSLQEPTAV